MCVAYASPTATALYNNPSPRRAASCVAAAAHALRQGRPSCAASWRARRSGAVCCLSPPSRFGLAHSLIPPAHTTRCADRLQVDEPVTTVPTIGFNVETLQYKNIKFQVRREAVMGGQRAAAPAHRRCMRPPRHAPLPCRCGTWEASRPFGRTGGVITQTRTPSYSSSTARTLSG